MDLILRPTILKCGQPSQEDYLFIAEAIEKDQNNVLDRNGYSALHVAAKYGLMDSMTQILKKDKTLLDYQSGTGIHGAYTPATISALYDQFLALKFLIARNANLTIGPNLLYLACVNPDTRFLKLVAKAGVDLNQMNSNFTGSTLVNHLVHKKHFNEDKLDIALCYGADAMITGFRGLTAFHYAIRDQSIEALMTLIETIGLEDSLYQQKQQKCCQSLIYQDRCQHEKNIFTYAVVYGSEEIVDLLLPLVDRKERKRQCDENDPFAPACLLHAAIFHRIHTKPLEDVVGLLLDDGFKPHKCNIKVDRHFKLRCDQFEVFNGTVFQHLDKCYGKSLVRLNLLGCAILRGNFEVVYELVQDKRQINPSIHNCGANPNYSIPGKYGSVFPVQLASCLFAKECLSELQNADAYMSLSD